MALLRRILYPDDSIGGKCDSYCGVPPFCEPCIPPAPIPVGSPPTPKWVFPPPPAGPWIDVNMTTSVVTHKTHRPVTLIALVISSILAAFFLLVTYYVLFLRVRAHVRRRRDAAAAAAAVVTAGGPGPSPDEDEGEGAAFFNQNNGGVHHVWFIRTVGLEQPMIDSITVCPYKRGDGLIESTDCSVCLSEFQDGELVRLLPKCCHAFHLPCIDTWLRSHLNCPLCRAPIVAPALPSAAPVEAAASSAAAAAAPVVGGPDPSVPAAAVVVSESTDADSSDDSSVGDEQQRTPSLRMIFAVPEDREETGILEDSASGTQSIPLAPQLPVASLSVAELGFRVQSDLGASRIHQHLRRDDEWVTIDLGPDRGIQPGRRSVSMDLSAIGALFHREEEEEESDDNTRGAVSSRKAQLPPCPRVALPATAAGIWMMKHGRDFKGCNNNLQKQALEMGRCSSTSSGGYIFSRLGRGRTRSHASILPL